MFPFSGQITETRPCPNISSSTSPAEFVGIRSYNLRSVFQLTPDGGLNVLHSFRGLKDGASSFAGLIRDEAGHLFGTTVKNFLIQPIQGGNVFEIRP